MADQNGGRVEKRLIPPTATFPDGNRPLSEEIERQRVLFEQTWGQPDVPSIEQFLFEVPQADRPYLLRELLYIEFELTQRQTAELSLEQYLERFPEHEAIVREVADAVSQYTVFKRRNIAGYTLLGELGRGGMGVVYRAKSDLLNTIVAIKMVSQRVVSDPEALRRFSRELEMIGRLKHPNIVEAKHAGIAPDGSPFLVMEFVEGITLNQWSKQNPPSETQDSSQVSESSKSDKTRSESLLEPSRIAEACAIIRDVALGLQAIHEAGLVHRDIKPRNIMLLPDGRVKILDLGLAKLRERIVEHNLEHEPQTQQGDFLGTLGYVAPEQMYSAAHVDIRADIYSLGCTFFFLLYGRAPTTKKSKALPVSLPQQLQTIIDRMLAADPFARFQEPQEVVAALDMFLCPPQKPRQNQTVAIVTILVFVGFALDLFGALFGLPYMTRDIPSPPISSEPQISDTEPTTNSNTIENNAIESIAIKTRLIVANIQAAVDLRYRGNDEQASEDLRVLADDLRANPFDDSNVLLAEVLSAQGDCLFFAGFASDALPEKMVRRLTAWYEEALALVDESSTDLRTKLLCKLSVVSGDAGRIPRNETEPSQYLHFAEAVTATNEQALWNFIEQFELSTEPTLFTREALDLRLFALERLLDRNKTANRDNFAKAQRALDVILLVPYPEAEASMYLNRYFDLVIRSCDPADYGQLVRYLYRLRPQVKVGGRTPFPPEATSFLVYFSHWSDENGFAIYYPAERHESRQFELPFNRRTVKEAIRRGESLTLDAELVLLIRHDVNSGVPLVLSWDDTACWHLRRDALTNEDWPFDNSISMEEILGQMK